MKIFKKCLKKDSNATNIAVKTKCIIAMNNHRK